MATPRAYTEKEVRDLLLKQIRVMVRYWANLPNVDKATGRQITIHDRCDGVAYSILNILDGVRWVYQHSILRQLHTKKINSFTSRTGKIGLKKR